MYCSKCGQQLVERANFCSGCGKGAGSGLVASYGIGRGKALYVFTVIAIVALGIAAANALLFSAADSSYTSGTLVLAQAQDEDSPQSIGQRLESIEQRLESIEYKLERIAGYVSWDRAYAFDMEYALNAAISAANTYRNWLIAAGFGLDGIHDNENFVWGDEVLIGPGGTPPPRQHEVVFRPVIPRRGFLEHFIEPGQSLASIAQIYWPHNPETPSGRLIRDELVRHLASTNNIADPEIIFVGTWLKIYEHPHIEQVFD